MGYVVPTLDSTFILTDPPKIIAYIIRQYSTALKHTTSVMVEETISLMDQISKYGSDDPSRLVQSIREDLVGVFSRIFHDATSMQIDPVIDRFDDSGRYNIILNVTVYVNEIAYQVSSTFSVDTEGRVTTL